MAHYERLANGKYAYTTTIQVISGEDFTNPNRAIYQGCLRLLSSSSATPSESSRNNAYKCPIYLSSISVSDYGIKASNCGISTTSVTMSTSNPPILASKEIDGETYYGVQVYDSLGFVFNIGSSNSKSYLRFYSAKITVSYIPNGTTQIMQKQVIFNGATSSGYGIQYCYFGLGMTVGDIILNINVDSSGN